MLLCFFVVFCELILFILVYKLTTFLLLLFLHHISDEDDDVVNYVLAVCLSLHLQYRVLIVSDEI